MDAHAAATVPLETGPVVTQQPTTRSLDHLVLDEPSNKTEQGIASAPNVEVPKHETVKSPSEKVSENKSPSGKLPVTKSPSEKVSGNKSPCPDEELCVGAPHYSGGVPYSIPTDKSPSEKKPVIKSPSAETPTVESQNGELEVFKENVSANTKEPGSPKESSDTHPKSPVVESSNKVSVPSSSEDKTDKPTSADEVVDNKEVTKNEGNGQVAPSDPVANKSPSDKQTSPHGKNSPSFKSVASKDLEKSEKLAPIVSPIKAESPEEIPYDKIDKTKKLASPTLSSSAPSSSDSHDTPSSPHKENKPRVILEAFSKFFPIKSQSESEKNKPKSPPGMNKPGTLTFKTGGLEPGTESKSQGSLSKTQPKKDQDGSKPDSPSESNSKKKNSDSGTETASSVKSDKPEKSSKSDSDSDSDDD